MVGSRFADDEVSKKAGLRTFAEICSSIARLRVFGRHVHDNYRELRTPNAQHNKQVKPASFIRFFPSSIGILLFLSPPFLFPTPLFPHFLPFPFIPHFLISFFIYFYLLAVRLCGAGASAPGTTCLVMGLLLIALAQVFNNISFWLVLYTTRTE